MPSFAERLDLFRFFWAIGTVVLFWLGLFLAVFGLGAFALVSSAAWLLGLDAWFWFLAVAFAWAPVAVGSALSAMSREVMVVCLNGAGPTANVG